MARIFFERQPSPEIRSYAFPDDPPYFIQYKEQFFGCKSGWTGRMSQHWQVSLPEEEEGLGFVPVSISHKQIVTRDANLAFFLDEDLEEITRQLTVAPCVSSTDFRSLFPEPEQLEQASQDIAPKGGYITEQEEALPYHEVEEPSILGGEARFIEDLDTTALSNYLVYDREDLVNFHTAVKTGSLVILAGMSGVGKSQLVINYAKTLGLSGVDEDANCRRQFLFIPVRPHWNDDADLIGYYDVIHKIYRPAETGLVDLLIEASRDENKDKLYLVCFDEMNLAKVEHYFSQFLSILELTEDRYLTLYSEKITPEVYNRHEYPARVPIGNNVFFIGTVNIDEYSYQFSDKVLDRANVIKLKISDSLRQWKQDFDSKTKAVWEEIKKNPSQKNKHNSLVPGNVFASWCNTDPTQIGLLPHEIDFLDELNSRLRQIHTDRVVGYRIIRQIGLYLKNIPCGSDGLSLLDRKKAFDLQLLQRILTKIKGAESDLEKVFGKYDEISNAKSSIIDLFNQFNTVSDFTYSRSESHKKAKELIDHGYAS